MNIKCKTCAASTRYGINHFCGYLEVVLDEKEDVPAPCEQPFINNEK